MNTDEFDHLRESIYRAIRRVEMEHNVRSMRVLIVDMPEFILKAAVNLYDTHVTPGGIPKVDKIYGVPCQERKASDKAPKGIYIEAWDGRLYPVV